MKNFITYLKTKKNLSDEIKNMTIEEKIKELDSVYKTLKNLPYDIDYDLLVKSVKVIEEVYYQAKACKVPKEYLKKIEELIDLRKKDLKNKKKSEKNFKDNLGNLDELFDDLDINTIELSNLNTEDSSSKIINPDKFIYKKGDIDIIDDKNE